MSNRASLFEGKSLEFVADMMAGSDPGSNYGQAAKAEFMLRQTKAQISAACATEETAKATKKYTRYMFWSVVVLALSALGSLVITLVSICRR